MTEMSVQIAAASSAATAASAAPRAAATAEAATAAELDISVLVPVLDEAETVEELGARVAAVLDSLGVPFEVLFVDDGSRDGTAERVRAAHGRDPRVKLLRLRRNFGKAAALSAGVEHSRGRIVITMDGDLQDDHGNHDAPARVLDA